MTAKGGASFSEICDASQPDYAFLAIDEKTLHLYNRRILAYCWHFGLLAKAGGIFVLGDPVRDIMEFPTRMAPISEVDIFRAAAPPERVLELIDLIRSGACATKADAERLALRNAVFAASTLGLVAQQDGVLTLSELALNEGDTSELIRRAVTQIEPFKNSLPEFDQPGLSADELGAVIAELYGLNWSTGSCKRHGAAIKRWVQWLD